MFALKRGVESGHFVASEGTVEDGVGRRTLIFTRVVSAIVYSAALTLNMQKSTVNQRITQSLRGTGACLAPITAHHPFDSVGLCQSVASLESYRSSQKAEQAHHATAEQNLPVLLQSQLAHWDSAVVSGSCSGVKFMRRYPAIQVGLSSPRAPISRRRDRCRDS
jgi:hypothetical protein